jgi:lactoylglutathione lyase
MWMDLGAFSVSLAVKDLDTSKAFYKKLGLVPFGRDIFQNWLIMKYGP